ncbi:MAG: DUF4105 domain-containing protein [Gemmatimonadales bacterium]
MLRAADRRGKVVMTGMTHRYRPDVQAVRSFVRPKRTRRDLLGPGELAPGPSRSPRPAGGARKRTESGGGAMLDLGLTMLDLGAATAQQSGVTRVSATLSQAGERRNGRSSSPAAPSWSAKRGGDLRGRHLAAHRGGERFGAGIRGSKGSAGINPLHVWKEIHGLPHDVSPTGSGSRDTAFVASFKAQWAHFLAAAAGRVAAPPLEEQVQVLGSSKRSTSPTPTPAKRILAIAFAGLAAALLTAQPAVPIRMLAPEPTDSAEGAGLTVYLLTFDPGAIVWERFGHNALLIRDNRSGRDVAFDYGRFDFGHTFGDQLRFVGRFAQGLMDYSMGAGSGDAYIPVYAAADRSIWSQELRASRPPPVAPAVPAVERARGGRVYRYSFYTDNCSTRIRDARSMP